MKKVYLVDVISVKAGWDDVQFVTAFTNRKSAEDYFIGYTSQLHGEFTHNDDVEFEIVETERRMCVFPKDNYDKYHITVELIEKDVEG